MPEESSSEGGGRGGVGLIMRAAKRNIFRFDIDFKCGGATVSFFVVVG